MKFFTKLFNKKKYARAFVESLKEENSIFKEKLNTLNLHYQKEILSSKKDHATDKKQLNAKHIAELNEISQAYVEEMTAVHKQHKKDLAEFKRENNRETNKKIKEHVKDLTQTLKIKDRLIKVTKEENDRLIEENDRLRKAFELFEPFKNSLIETNRKMERDNKNISDLITEIYQKSMRNCDELNMIVFRNKTRMKQAEKLMGHVQDTQEKRTKNLERQLKLVK